MYVDWNLANNLYELAPYSCSVYNQFSIPINIFNISFLRLKLKDN